MSPPPTPPSSSSAGRARTRVAVPADVDRPDRLLAGLTARQVLIVAATAAGLWLIWQAARHVVSPVVFAAAAAPVVAVAFALAVGVRDGLGLDRWVAAAVAHARAPRRRVHAPEGVPGPPGFWPEALSGGPVPAPADPLAAGITPDGTVDLGRDGTALLARASTVNFALRTPAEQDALIGAFAAWLNGLDAPVQLLVRATRLDLTAAVEALRENAPALTHPLLEAAALDHAAFLADLAVTRDLLHRQVLLVHHRPATRTRHDADGATASVASRLHRLAEHAAHRLAAADVHVTTLDGPAATALLTAVCNPDPITSDPEPWPEPDGNAPGRPDPGDTVPWPGRPRARDEAPGHDPAHGPVPRLRPVRGRARAGHAGAWPHSVDEPFRRS
jgi:hypothetical protein